MTAQSSEVLGAMISPAVFISAVALLLLSTTNRLSRVIDRIGGYIEQAQRVEGQAAALEVNRQKHDLALRQLDHLLHRLLLLRAAVMGMYLTIGLLLLTSISAGLNLLIPQVSRLVPISLDVLGAVCFLYCVVVLVREALIAVRDTLEEIDCLRALLESQRLQAEERAGG